MENNRNYFIAIALSVLIVLGWQFFYMNPRLEAQRIAVHRRSVERRLRQASSEVFGQDASLGHIDRNAFETMKRRRTVQQARLCFGNG